MASALHHRVLVLNRLWQAVHVCSVQRAIALLCMDHACVVRAESDYITTFSFDEWILYGPDVADGDVLRTVSRPIPVPRVILLVDFDRLPRREVRLTRRRVLERDRHTCQYCRREFDSKQLNIDHVVPRQRGGKTRWNNVVCSCLPCNTRKANRTPEEAGMHLLRKPEKPHWRPVFELKHSSGAHSSWRHFIDPSHWELSATPQYAGI